MGPPHPYPEGISVALSLPPFQSSCTVKISMFPWRWHGSAWKLGTRVLDVRGLRGILVEMLCRSQQEGVRRKIRDPCQQCPSCARQCRDASKSEGLGERTEGESASGEEQSLALTPAASRGRELREKPGKQMRRSTHCSKKKNKERACPRDEGKKKCQMLLTDQITSDLTEKWLLNLATQWSWSLLTLTRVTWAEWWEWLQNICRE